MRPPRALKALWDKKLKDSGFNDIERPNGRLKEHDTRTQSFRFRDELIAYFTELECFLSENEEKIPLQHFIILKMHCEGLHNREIERALAISHKGLYNILKPYKSLITARVLKNTHIPDL